MNDPLSVDEATQVMQKIMPIRQGDLSLQLASHAPIAERDDALFVTLQLFVYDAGQISVIKEQEVLLLLAQHREISTDRFEAFVSGWALALRSFFEQRGPAVVDRLMPHDLLFADVAGMKRPQSAEEFAQACGTKKRLGRW